MQTTPNTHAVISIASRQHSLSAVMWNAAFERLGLDRFHWPQEVEAEDIRDAVAGVRSLGFIGAVISVPHKETIVRQRLLDHYTEEVMAIGAVNTITRQRTGNGRIVLTGHNTDWLGAVRALSTVTPLRDKRIAILGAGGLSRAITYGLLREGARVDIFNRTLQRG
ncbi:MAG: hypothetical protein AAB834_03775, partial [Patescibacteria group bacterium]